MAYSITLSGQGALHVTEIADSTTTLASGSNGASRLFDAFNKTVQYTSGSSPTLHGNVVDISRTLGATDTDIDLTAAPLARDLAETADLTGFKLAMLLFWVVSGNAAGVTLKPHPTTNAYNLFGTSGQLTVFPGEHFTKLLLVGSTIRTPAVAAGAKVIRLTGNSGDIVRGLLVFGS